MLGSCRVHVSGQILPALGGERERENILHKLDMRRHKDFFFYSGIKTEEDTLRKGVAKKDIHTRFWVEFVGSVGTQPWKT